MDLWECQADKETEQRPAVPGIQLASSKRCCLFCERSGCKAFPPHHYLYETQGGDICPEQNPPGGGVPKGGRELRRSQVAPSLLVSIFSFVVIVCIAQQSKGLITVGRLSPLETQFLPIYKSNVSQTSELFGGAT